MQSLNSSELSMCRVFVILHYDSRGVHIALPCGKRSVPVLLCSGRFMTPNFKGSEINNMNKINNTIVSYSERNITKLLNEFEIIMTTNILNH